MPPQIKMFSPLSTSAKIPFYEDRSVFRYSPSSWMHRDLNKNNSEPSLSQAQAPELSLRGSYIPTPPSPSLGMKRQHHPTHEDIAHTRQLVNISSPGHEEVASHSRWTTADGHPSEGFAQLLPGTNLQEYFVSTGSRREKPSTLSKPSWLNNQTPSYSKYTLGVPVPTFLFPQQVSFPGDSPSRNSGQYSADSSFRSSTSSCSDQDTSFSPTVRYHVDSETLFGDIDSPPRRRTDSFSERFAKLRPPLQSPIPGMKERRERLSTSSFRPGKPDYSVFKMEQQAIKRDKEKHEVTKRQRPDPSSVSGYFSRGDDSMLPTPGSASSELDSFVFPSPERFPPRSPVSPAQSPPGQFEGNRGLKKLAVDKSIHFTPPSPRSPSDGRRGLRKLSVDESIHFTPPTPYSQPAPQEYYEFDDQEDSPAPQKRRLLPVLSLDTSPASSPAPQKRRLLPPSFLDTSSGSDSPGSDLSPTPPMRRGMKAPCCNLTPEFRKESSAVGKVQSITGREFDRFISTQEMAVVMFYDSTKNTQDTMNVWARESLKPNPSFPNQAYASVDCAMESDLCTRESISSYPLYKLYAGGYPISAVKHFKLLSY